MRTASSTLLVLALLAGCGDPIASNRPPLDRIFFPTGLAVAPRPGGGGDLLYVVNSNFQLDYVADAGGSVLVIDPEASVAPADGGVAPAAVLSGFRIPSYGGELVVAHPGLPGCEGLARTTVVVPVRYSNETYLLDVGADGALSCGDGCRVPSQGDAEDPFGVTVACRATAAGVRESAFVTHLSGRVVSGAPAGQGFVTEIDLASRAVSTPLNFGAGPTGQVVWDPSRGLVFAGPAQGSAGFAPLRWWRPGVAAADGSVDFAQTDVNAFVPASIVRGMSLSSDRQRLYVTADVFDSTLAANTGLVSVTGSVLLVLDITTNVLGQESLRAARSVPLGAGLGPLAVIPRPGRRDLLVVPDTTGNEVHLFDDEAGALVTSFGRDDLGRPFVREPYAVAPQALPGGAWRVWVASFRDGTLTAIEIADPNVPGTARLGKRIGNVE